MSEQPMNAASSIDAEGAERVRLAGERYRNLSPKDLGETVSDEERELDFDSFGLDDAWAVGCWIRATALTRGLAIGFAVSIGDHRAFHSATPGGSAMNDAWLDRKFRVVRMYNRATLGVRADYESRGESFAANSALDTHQYAADGGAFPIRVRGTLVGAAGVSGLEMHEDHAFVTEALRAHKAGETA